MRMLLPIVVSSLFLVAAGAVALAQHHPDSHAQASAETGDEAINAMCPIGKEPIAASAGTVEYKGHTIGLCCPSCGKNFLAWDEQRKDEFVTLAIAGKEPGHDRHGAQKGTGERGAEPMQASSSDGADASEVVEAQLMHYPIDTCIVSGQKLGSMGDPVNHVHEGRLVRFCCAMCEPKFSESPGTYLGKLDEMIVERQVGGYPLETCVVSGEELGSMGEPVNHIHDNRLVRFCCAMCKPTFEKDPDAFMSKLDAAYADAQRDDYPLDTCVVSGQELGSMGDPTELVAGTQLVRFCCAMCEPKFRKNPDQYLSKLEQD